MQKQSRPIPGKDYPRTFQEFDEWFRTDDQCRDFLYRIRWPEGFQCPRCGMANNPWITARWYLHCTKCEGEISVTAGTLFERTHKPLRDWFLAIWFVTSQKNGASALGLQRVLGLGSYETAWTWLHKLRRAMVNPERDRLNEAVEVDETYYGAPEKDVHGRENVYKSIIAVAAEIRGKGTGRIRMRRIEDASAESLVPFVQEMVSPGAIVRTDGWQGYSGLNKSGYNHKIIKIKNSGLKAHKLLPRVHRISSLLKRWLLGTMQGGVQQHHLDYYLDEFTFRFNRRNSKARGLLFYRLIQQAAIISPITYRDIVSGVLPPKMIGKTNLR